MVHETQKGRAENRNLQDLNALEPQRPDPVAGDLEDIAITQSERMQTLENCAYGV